MNKWVALGTGGLAISIVYNTFGFMWTAILILLVIGVYVYVTGLDSKGESSNVSSSPDREQKSEPAAMSTAEYVRNLEAENRELRKKAYANRYK